MTVTTDQQEKIEHAERYYPGLAAQCLTAYRLIIDAVRAAAKDAGYAIAVHGSLARDIDLIAVPWTEKAVPASELAEKVRLAAETANPRKLAFISPRDTCPESKPHGRLCWSFHLGAGPYIDLSVMPRTMEAV